MAWNTSIASSGASEQPTKVTVKIGGTQTLENPATVTAAWIAARSRERGWSKFIVKINDEEVEKPDDFKVVAGDTVEILVYDEFGS